MLTRKYTLEEVAQMLEKEMQHHRKGYDELKLDGFLEMEKGCQVAAWRVRNLAYGGKLGWKTKSTLWMKLVNFYKRKPTRSG